MLFNTLTNIKNNILCSRKICSCGYEDETNGCDKTKTLEILCKEYALCIVCLTNKISLMYRFIHESILVYSADLLYSCAYA